MKVYLFKGIFSHDKRRELIKRSDPFLMGGNTFTQIHQEREYPGKQTHGEIHSLPYFDSASDKLINLVNKKTGLNMMIEKSWINWTNGKKKDIAWHRHACDYALVYYMKTVRFFSDGTLFKDRFVRVPLNGALIFPANILHTAPSCPFRIGRYTWAFNLNKR